MKDWIETAEGKRSMTTEQQYAVNWRINQLELQLKEEANTKARMKLIALTVEDIDSIMEY